MTDAQTQDVNTFKPSHDLIQEQDCDTLILYLPGFKKEELRIQLSGSGLLKITGETRTGQDKLSSFQMEHQVSPHCNTRRISAKFEDGILYIRQPKLIVPKHKEETAKPTQEATKNDQEQADDTRKTVANDGPKKEELPKKSVQEEPKPGDKEEKASSENDDQERKSGSSSNERSDVPELVNPEFKKKGNVQNANTEVSPAAKLKKARKMMNVVLALLVAIGLGMFIRNLMWRSNSNELQN